MADEPQRIEKPQKVWEAERKKLEAEAEAAMADARQKIALARAQEAEARKAEIALEKGEYERRVELAADKYHHVYQFKDRVDQSTVEKCIQQLRIWARLEEGQEDKSPFEIVFFSPGGGVFDGLSLYDSIQQIRKKGHRVTVSSIGYAASMAGILLQAGDWRVMGAETFLLIHELAGMCSGKIGDVEDTMEFWKKIEARVIDIFYQRAQEAFVRDPETVTKPLTKRQIARKCERKDWWLTSEEALAHGFVDELS